MSKKLISSLVATTLALGVLALPVMQTSAVETDAIGAKLKLRILETSDIHTHIVNYDYYADKTIEKFGLAKTATLIQEARKEVKNSLLFDNGDLIQGNPLGDYVAKVKPLQKGQVHPVYKAMNLMSYDLATVGNHEFNFGLDFLNQSIATANFGYVNANVFYDDKDNNASNDKYYFQPYKILKKKFYDETGRPRIVKVGVTGFVTPQIMQWDQTHLQGKIIAKDIVESAKKIIPEIKAAGADIVVVLGHTGLDKNPTSHHKENTVYDMSKISDIDAILSGHIHVAFPGKDWNDIKGIDNVKGLVNNTPVVIPEEWGETLGMIDLTLQQYKGTWIVVDGQSSNRPVLNAKADQKIVDAVTADHENTVAYVRGPVGTTTAPINSFFALVSDDPSIQIVTNAQKWYLEKALKGTKYDGMPILSVGAPFKAGGRNGVDNYTDIPTGTIAIKDTANLYIYPNTVKAVEMNGADVKEWLEMSAGQFNQIDPNKAEEQKLINVDFPTYNYDVIDGVTYEIDVTQPIKYDKSGKAVNPNASRIKNLMFEGKPVTADMKFVLATNNYRASGGGNFPGLKGQNIILDAPDENRQALVDYIREMKTINPSADNNWKFTPINGSATVVFESSPKSKDFAANLSNIKYITTLETGYAKYSIDLSK